MSTMPALPMLAARQAGQSQERGEHGQCRHGGLGYQLGNPGGVQVVAERDGPGAVTERIEGHGHHDRRSDHRRKRGGGIEHQQHTACLVEGSGALVEDRHGSTICIQKRRFDDHLANGSG